MISIRKDEAGKHQTDRAEGSKPDVNRVKVFALPAGSKEGQVNRQESAKEP